MKRRSFLKVIPAAGLAGVSAAQGPQQQPAATRVKKESMHAAEQLIGIELTEAQETMALPGVDRALTGYENLRKINVPLDTEPAFAFHPAPPSKKTDSSLRAFKPGKVEAPAFKNIEDLAFCTTLQLAELVRTKKITPVALTRMYLDRLKRFGPKLICVVTLTEDLAMHQAEEATKEIARGKYRGPLHGIPWGAKDLFATKGIPTTWGAEPYRNQVIDYDSTVVERLNAAGAVLVAKLSMGALAQGGKWFAGVTRNPWQVDEDRIGSSGSSAGPASATAAGLVGFSIGTETLGSIVSPSSRCGVTGLRPTYGRISRFGAMGLCWTMDKIGPICRSVEDCAAAPHALYGPDDRDIPVPDVPFHWSGRVPLAQMRNGHRKARFVGLDVLQQGDAVAVGQAHVGEAQVEGVLVQHRLGFAHGAGAVGAQAHPGQGDLQQFPDIGLVVDDQRVCLAHGPFELLSL